MTTHEHNAAYLKGVPDEWNCLPLKRCFHISKRIAGELGYDVLSITQRGLKVRDITDFKGQLSSDYSKYQIVEPGDFAMNHMDLLTGWIDCSEQVGVTSPDYRVFKIDRDDFDKRYFLYFFQSCYNLRIFYGFGRGISGMGRWRLPADQFNNMMIPVPTPGTQKAIADYLDAKCVEIDKAIEAAEASIEEYKLYKKSVICQAVTKGLDSDAPTKDSGIEWIGKMPEDWVTEQVGRRANQTKCKNDGMVETNLLSLSYGKVKRRDINATEGLLPESFEGYNVIEENDIVLRFTDLQNDQKSLRVGRATERGIITSAYTTIRPFDPEDSEFLYYVLHSYDLKKGFYGMGAGVRQGLKWQEAKYIEIPWPDTQTRITICQFLDNKCDKIDKAIEAKRQIIDELKAYKKSLVWEAITGKREAV